MGGGGGLKIAYVWLNTSICIYMTIFFEMNVKHARKFYSDPYNEI